MAPDRFKNWSMTWELLGGTWWKKTPKAAHASSSSSWLLWQPIDLELVVAPAPKWTASTPGVWANRSTINFVRTPAAEALGSGKILPRNKIVVGLGNDRANDDNDDDDVKDDKEGRLLRLIEVGRHLAMRNRKHGWNNRYWWWPWPNIKTEQVWLPNYIFICRSRVSRPSSCEWVGKCSLQCCGSNCVFDFYLSFLWNDENGHIFWKQNIKTIRYPRTLAS